MNGRRDRAVPLTPDQIERRGFGIEARGYDRHEVREFLYQVGYALRVALQATGSPTYGPGPGPTATRGPLGPQVDVYDDAPSETARILRAAYHSATARKEEPAAADAAIVERARHEAHELLRRAHAEAEQQRDEARRVLLAAQEQAVDVVADAEARARELLVAAREEGRRQLDQLALALEERSYQVEEAEVAALQRLSAARAELSAAIEMLLGERAAVIEDHRAVSAGTRALGGAPAAGDDDEPAEDVVADLIRVAVARAATAGQGALPPAGADPAGGADAPALPAGDRSGGDTEPPGGPRGAGRALPPGTPPWRAGGGPTMSAGADAAVDDAGPGPSAAAPREAPTARPTDAPGLPWSRPEVEIVLHDPAADPWAPPLAPPRLLRPGAA